RVLENPIPTNTDAPAQSRDADASECLIGNGRIQAKWEEIHLQRNRFRHYREHLHASSVPRRVGQRIETTADYSGYEGASGDRACQQSRPAITHAQHARPQSSEPHAGNLVYLDKRRAKEGNGTRGTGEGTQVWRPGPGGRSIIEEEHWRNPPGEFDGFSVGWWDAKAEW